MTKMSHPRSFQRVIPFKGRVGINIRMYFHIYIVNNLLSKNLYPGNFSLNYFF